MELQEEMTPADAVLLMSSVPERISDLVFGLDETRLRYRHGPAFPTLGGLIFHLLDSGSKVDALLRHAHLDGLSTADVRATIDPSPSAVDSVGDLSRGRPSQRYRGLRQGSPEDCRPASRVGQERVGSRDLRSQWRQLHPARHLSHGHEARDGSCRPDTQSDRAPTGAAGPGSTASTPEPHTPTRRR